MSETQFVVGDVVTWKSQSAGHVKVKTGEIVAVVPSGRPAEDKVPSGDYSLPSGGFGGVRNHDSFLVRVDSGSNAKPIIYWPLVSLLRLEKKADAAPLPGDLPGIPAPSGPLAKATREFIKRRSEIEKAKENLRDAGKSIMEAMAREGKDSIAVETHGERYKFTVKASTSRLHMMKMKREITVD